MTRPRSIFGTRPMRVAAAEFQRFVEACNEARPPSDTLRESVGLAQHLAPADKPNTTP